MEIHAKLKHLSEADLKLLLQDYSKGEMTISEIAELYEIELGYFGELYKILPWIELAERCVHCGSSMWTPVRPRSLPGTSAAKQSKCDFCGHIEYQSGGQICKCSGCILQREKDALKEYKNLEKAVLDVCTPYYASEMFTLNHFSLLDSIYLLATFRASNSENLLDIGPIPFNSLAPTVELEKHILSVLEQKGLIGVSPNSSVEAFKIENGRAVSYKIYHVQYRTLIAPDQLGTQDQVSALERVFREVQWPSTWTFCVDIELDDIFRLWKKVALNECLQFLDFCCTERKFDFSPGPKTLQIFKSVLESYSVSQVFAMIWRAAQSAVDFYHRKNVAKQHAVNTIPGHIKTFSERALAEGWSVKGFSRNYELPPTAIANVLYGLVLKLGDKAIEVIPGRNKIPFDLSSSDSFLE